VNEKENLRTWVAGRLDLQELPNIVWEVLSHRGYVQATLEGEVSRAVLSKQAQTLLLYGDVLESSVRESEFQGEDQNPEYPVADDNEIERGKVVAEYLALSMAVRTPLCSFRDTMEIWLDGSYEERRRAIRELQENPQTWRDYLGSHRTETEEEPPTLLEETEEEPPTLLERAARYVVRNVFGYWTQEEAIAFLLADKVSSRQPLQIDSQEDSQETPNEQGAINLRIEPWVSTQTLVDFFQYERNRKLGRRPRAIAARNLEVARFVFLVMRGRWYGHRLPHAKVPEDTKGLWYEEILKNYSWLEGSLQGAPSWQKLVDLWNRHHPEQQYKGTRRFHTDFHRGARAVVPPYSLL
jgi:hypothetical protein